MTKTRLSKILCDAAQENIDKSTISVKLRQKRIEVSETLRVEYEYDIKIAKCFTCTAQTLIKELIGYRQVLVEHNHLRSFPLCMVFTLSSRWK